MYNEVRLFFHELCRNERLCDLPKVREEIQVLLSIEEIITTSKLCRFEQSIVNILKH